ncbi:hypothetical protein [Streptomyces lavendulae]|uniref:hypothetical protein n=1 Tax=Streptomyces lavendulae TaxID=1914 RepID=UPI00255232E7|nr:hypothetical protein [Streptomyces lavendulae]
MSESVGESVGAGEPYEQTGQDGSGVTPKKPAGGRRPRGRRARWAAVGAAAVVVIGGGAAAAAIHHHEEEGRGEHAVASAGDHERHDESREDSEGRDGHDARHADGERGTRADDSRGPSTGVAPAPLPSLSAADAVNKAAAAVNDGKVESLAPVTEQGGGRAWRIVVVGPDGVRHAVTVDGTSGTLTGNTVLGG